MKSSLLALAAALSLSSCAAEAPQANAASASTVGAASAAAACPAGDFDGFLKAYAADGRVRAAHTAPSIEVTDWVDVDETGLGTTVTRVPRSDYLDFKLRLRGGAYVHVEHDDMPDPIPVRPRVTPQPDGYRVEYIFNMSEGNSWSFRRTGDCWQLVADPDPSLL